MKTIINNAVHHHHACDPALRELLMGLAASQTLILTTLQEITMSMEQLRSDLQTLQATQATTLQAVTKISGETSSLLAKIAELQAAVDAGADVPEDVKQLVADLTAGAAAVNEALAGVDALVADPAAPVDPEQPAG